MSAPAVTVVIPHHDSPDLLRLVLAGLDEQTMPAEDVEVVIADDGSPTPPEPGQHAYPVRVLTQERRGFRAAAARNLGWQAARGEVVCFLDGDTVPGPAYLAALVAPCLGETTVAVGRRRHVDLGGWSPQDVRAWLRAEGPSPASLPDPQWLQDGYAATADLREADDASFRFVISAVLAMPRALLERTGGFEESFSSYGGEDWDLAHRCWLAGADLRHVPEAVAWHDGPDLAGRESDLATTKNRETVQLAEVLTHPLVRGRSLVYDLPEVAVQLSCAGWSAGQTVIVLDALLARGDIGIWLAGCHEVPLPDPRVRAGTVPERVLARCRYQLRGSAPSIPHGWSLTDPRWPDGQDAAEPGDGWAWASTRELNRRASRGGPPAWRPVPAAYLEAVPPTAVIERWRGRLVTG